ncbi:MAG: patatin-like phospholipase family protein [Rhodobacteraceae bacterium]|nr:patatin-like phospholipase family protein [Paracoccaceae bacterium]
MANETNYKTILSLDGGGIRGLILVRILQESRSGQRIHEFFDLVVGTSTSGILAPGLARPMNEQSGGPCPTEELAGLYTERAVNVF